MKLKVALLSLLEASRLFLSRSPGLSDQANPLIVLWLPALPPMARPHRDSREVSRRLGQPIVIENEGGAGAIPGSARVARLRRTASRCLCNPSNTVVNPLIFKELPYDTSDFVAVANTSAQG